MKRRQLVIVQQKRLSGELIEWDPEMRCLCVKFKKWWEPDQQEAAVTFVLDPYAIVTSIHRGTLTLSELNIGQRVTVTYVSGMGGHPIAKTLTISKALGSRRRNPNGVPRSTERPLAEGEEETE